MDDLKKQAGERISQISDALGITNPVVDGTKTIPWNPDSTTFPTRKELPVIEGAPKDAAWVWGKDDALGRLNLLTPTRVAAAAREIKTGEIVPVNLPLQHPGPPAFGREEFKHEIKALEPGLAYDDLYTMNTQSGTQWDGFRHCADSQTKMFYNGATSEDFTGPTPNQKCSIHYWAEHGIAGRGILLDFSTWAKKNSIVYDVNSSFEITYDMLSNCGKAQGVDIRPAAQGGDIKPGDILFVRSGWVESYWTSTPEQRRAVSMRTGAGQGSDRTRFCGVSQEDQMLDWLHDCYFSCLAGDAPAFEAWPPKRGFFLHEYILPRWGMPLGEMLDLERLSQKCAERGRWTLFFSSMPASCIGGVGSHVNGQAIF